MSSGPTAQYRVDSDGVAIITLTNPPVNALHPAGEKKETNLICSAAATSVADADN